MTGREGVAGSHAFVLLTTYTPTAFRYVAAGSTRLLGFASRMGSIRPVAKLLLIGLVFHLVYIGSVFDCYFTSPVVNGMRRFKTETSHTKRLVLIVGTKSLLRKDGLCTKPSQVTVYVRTY